VLFQAELEAELTKKKARAARFNLPVKTTAEEVRPECHAYQQRNAQGHSLEKIRGMKHLVVECEFKCFAAHRRSCD
jgi:hypothetical protein